MSNNKAFIILFLFLIMGASVFSQSTTNSPYSKYGVGILRAQYFSQNFGMGGAGIGLRSDRNIGIQNPASYSGITVTTFDLGYTNNALWLDDGTETQYQNNPYIDHIAFAFPMVKKVWGMSFGALPFSNVGYQFDEVINDPIAGDVSIFNEGEGAINKAYLGNALAFKLDSTSLISFGANTYFLFGSISRDQKVIFGDLANSFNIWQTEDISVSDFGVDFGVQYQKSFVNTKEDKFKLILGATYGLSADMNAKRTALTRTFTGNIDFGTIKDTAEFIDDVDDVLQLPSELGFGVSLEKQNKWLLAIDYKASNWGSVASNDPLITFKSNYSLATGIQIIPKYDGNNYFQRLAYRVGARYATSHIAVNNIDWSEYGITFGIGLPIRKSEFSYPRLNLGLEYGSRGTIDSGLIKEKFLNFNLGITINAVWFRKRKYD